MINENGKVVVFDFDTTLNTLLDTWIFVLNFKYGLNIEYEDITTWDMRKSINNALRKSRLCVKDNADIDVYGVLEHRWFWDLVRIRPGAFAAIYTLQKKGYKVKIATGAINYNTIAPKLECCLYKWLPKFNKEDVIITSHKEDLKCDYLIDDYYKNLTNSSAYRILIDQPYNEEANRGVDFDYIARQIDQTSALEHITNKILKLDGYESIKFTNEYILEAFNNVR